jgi:hypothetical protein
MTPLSAAMALLLMPIQGLTDANQDWYAPPPVEVIEEELTLQELEFQIRYADELEDLKRARGSE